MSENQTEPTHARLTEAHAAANCGQFERAERLLLEVLAEDASNLLALDTLGFVQYFLGRPDQAEQACRHALAIAPDRAYSNKGLGLCLAKQGKLDEGIPFLHRAIELEPVWFDPRWDLAVVLTEAGRYQEALTVLDDGERVLPSAAPRFNDLRRQIAGLASPTGPRP
jgi:tetratricopeptide (TPR) repeat protein